MTHPFDRDPPARPHGVSRTDLERYAAGEALPAELTQRIESEVALMDEVRALRGEIEAFAGSAPPLRALEAAPEPAPAARVVPLSRWLGGGAGLLAAAAALLLVLRAGPLAEDPTSRPDIALKGAAEGPRFDVHVSARGEPAARVDGPLRVRPGSRLRFVVRDGPRAGHVAVFALEASGRISRFVPAEGTVAPVVPSGGPNALDGTIEVDAYPGKEWLVFVWVPDRFDLATVERALAGLPHATLGAKAESRIADAVRAALDAPGAHVEARRLGRTP